MFTLVQDKSLLSSGCSSSVTTKRRLTINKWVTCWCLEVKFHLWIDKTYLNRSWKRWASVHFQKYDLAAKVFSFSPSLRLIKKWTVACLFFCLILGAFLLAFRHSERRSLSFISIASSLKASIFKIGIFGQFLKSKNNDEH